MQRLGTRESHDQQKHTDDRRRENGAHGTFREHRESHGGVHSERGGPTNGIKPVPLSRRGRRLESREFADDEQRQRQRHAKQQRGVGSGGPRRNVEHKRGEQDQTRPTTDAHIEQAVAHRVGEPHRADAQRGRPESGGELVDPE